MHQPLNSRALFFPLLTLPLQQPIVPILSKYMICTFEGYSDTVFLRKFYCGDVYRAVSIGDARPCILYRIDLETIDDEALENVSRDYRFCSQLSCPFIRRYTRILEEKSTVILESEDCANGTLEQLLADQRNGLAQMPITENLIWEIAAQLLKALEYLHHPEPSDQSAPEAESVHSPIVHHNINPSCIYFDSSGNVKLGGFEHAKTGPSFTRGFLAIGSSYHMAPEMAQGEQGATYTTKIDIWSLGCVLLEVATMKLPPFDPREIMGTPQVFIKDFSFQLSRFIHRCLIFDPVIRPSAKDLLTNCEIKIALERLVNSASRSQQKVDALNN
ncbi:Serine/threonine protein kinase [Giardia duodenalis]|uniref:Serine/threonine protein kinase n=1 Tax=Giardia intestinalis TaxID=5741 RepID=V6TFW8_GIAIN|nr:Serine/threonine protein kinase [Giardia intestinalis]